MRGESRAVSTMSHLWAALFAVVVLGSPLQAQTLHERDRDAVTLAVSMISELDKLLGGAEIIEQGRTGEAISPQSITRLAQFGASLPTSYDKHLRSAKAYQRALVGDGAQMDARRTFAETLVTMPLVLERLRAILPAQVDAQRRGDQTQFELLTDEMWRLSLSAEIDMAAIYTFQAALAPEGTPIRIMFLSVADCLRATSWLDYATQLNRDVWRRRHRAAHYLATADDLARIERNLRIYDSQSAAAMKTLLRAQQARLGGANTRMQRLARKAAIASIKQSNELIGAIMAEQTAFRAILREASRALRYTVKDNLASFEAVHEANLQLREALVPIVLAQYRFEAWSEKMNAAFQNATRN